MNALKKAQASWGDELPVWVAVMAEQCDATSQKKVADMMVYSPSTISQVLANKYAGALSAVEQAVNGAFLSVTVNCPVLGELPAHHCLEKQRQPYAATNSSRVMLYKLCHGSCQHSRTGGNHE